MVEYIGNVPPRVHEFVDDIANRTIPWFGVAVQHQITNQPVLLQDRVVMNHGVWYFAFVSDRQVLYSGSEDLPPAALQKIIPQLVGAIQAQAAPS